MLSLRLWILPQSREPATWQDLLPVFTTQYCPLICTTVHSGKRRQHCCKRLPQSCRFSTAEQHPEFYLSCIKGQYFGPKIAIWKNQLSIRQFLCVWSVTNPKIIVVLPKNVSPNQQCIINMQNLASKSATYNYFWMPQLKTPKPKVTIQLGHNIRSTIVGCQQ